MMGPRYAYIDTTIEASIGIDQAKHVADHKLFEMIRT